MWPICCLTLLLPSQSKSYECRYFLLVTVLSQVPISPSAENLLCDRYCARPWADGPEPGYMEHSFWGWGARWGVQRTTAKLEETALSAQVPSCYCKISKHLIETNDYNNSTLSLQAEHHHSFNYWVKRQTNLFLKATAPFLVTVIIPLWICRHQQGRI